MTVDVKNDTLIQDMLDRVANAVREGDMRCLRTTISEAWSAKVQHKLAAQPEFRNYFNLLAARVADQGDEQRFLALAEMGRLCNSIKSTRAWIPPIAVQLLAGGVPESFQFGDHRQREHAAIAVLECGAPVDSDTLSRAAVAEEKSKNVRRVWIRALLERMSLPEVFEGIARAIAEIQETGHRRSLRLQHILETLNEQLPQVDIHIDEDICDAFRRFISKAFYKAPRPTDSKKSAPAVEELVKVSIQLIHFRFRLGADPEFYGAVAFAERWLPKGGWRWMTSTSATLKQLRQTLLEGLLLLLEQGKPDNDLLDAHRALSPNARFAQKELQELEKSVRNLPAEFRNWLVSSGAKTLVAKPAELDETDDLSIAMAMIVADALRHRTDSSVDAMLNDIRFKAPVHVESITNVVDLTKQLIDRVSFLADRRQLRLFGSLGEVVEFSPYAYRLPEDAPLTRRVQIRSPGVEKRGRSASRIIVPALVEAST